jgi:glucose/arabinose dehydrogenase
MRNASPLSSIAGALGVIVGLGSATAEAAVLDTNFVETEVATLEQDADLTGMAFVPDGTNRLFLIGKEGLIHVVEDGVRRPEPFAVVSPLYIGSECGIVGVAFDPDFVSNHYVYVFATVSAQEQRIIRFRDEGSVGVDETVVVSGLPTRGLNHDGGAIGFGPDGKLYFAVGDLGNGTGAGNDLTLLAAKVGRANRDGSVPGDNPFDDGGGPNNDFVWARGFRNPFSMTFQPTTGRMWLDVVGTSYEQVFVVGAGDHAGWSMYEYSQPAGFIRPVINYRTNDTETYTVATDGAVRAAGVVTFSMTEVHRVLVGAEVNIAGVADSSFDGTGVVVSVPSPERLTIEQSGPDGTSGGGSLAQTNLGGCITGGVFYDSTAASAEYRGNFFFGDFNSGRIMRTRVGATIPESVRIWGTGHESIVDMAVGHDGDLHYVRYNGDGVVFRARFQATAQGIVLSHANPWMIEGGRAVVRARLAVAPTEPVTVSAARESGDSDVSVSAGQVLVFEANDWSVPKSIELRAARDADATDDLTTLRVSANGIPAETISVRVIDEFQDSDPGEGGGGGDGPGGNGGVDQGGGAGVGGTGGGAGDPSGAGQAGAPGGAGESTGRSRTGRASLSEGGCGCVMNTTGEGGAALLVVLAGLLCRRIKPHRKSLGPRSSARFE